MSAAASAPTNQPSRAGRLLGLIRKLIDYGREIAATLQQPGTNADLATYTHRFGIRDIRSIIARIARGLLRARLLEKRILRSANRLDAEPRPKATPSPRPPRDARPAAPQAIDTPRLPAAEQIAAEARRKPIGAVVADICRDLGITPGHPLWRELSDIIVAYGGNLASLIRDTFQRRFPPLSALAAQLASAAPPAPEPVGTGPP